MDYWYIFLGDQFMDTLINSWSYSNFSLMVIFVSLDWYFNKLIYSDISENKLSSTCWKNQVNIRYTNDFMTILMAAFYMIR